MNSPTTTHEHEGVDALAMVEVDNEFDSDYRAEGIDMPNTTTLPVALKLDPLAGQEMPFLKQEVIS